MKQVQKRMQICCWIKLHNNHHVYLFKNECSSCDGRNYSEGFIDSKKEADVPRDAEGHKISPYERCCLSKIAHNQSYLNKLVLVGGSMLKKA